MTKRALWCLVLLGALSAPLKAQEQTAFQFLSAYLDTLTHMQGHFLQTSPQGERLKGRFYLSPPGLMRFEYDPPHQKVVIADGVWIISRNPEGEGSDRYPLSNTPLGALLSGALEDIAFQSQILSQTPEGVVIQVNYKEIAGTLILEFSTEPVMLRSWRVRTPHGQETQVTLFDVVSGVPPDRGLFRIEEYDPFKQSRP